MEARNGHPYFYALCDAIQILHSKKNYDYAKGGDALGNFRRVSVLMQNYPGMEWNTPEGVAVTYMLKQIDAYLWMKTDNHESCTGEGVLERLKDVMVYAGILSCIEKENQERVKTNGRIETTSIEPNSLRSAFGGESSVPRAEEINRGTGYTGPDCDSGRWDDTIRTQAASGRTSDRPGAGPGLNRP